MLTGWQDDSLCLGQPKGDIRACEPLHTAVETLKRVGAVQEPRRLPMGGIDHCLTASRPLRRLQALHKGGRKGFCDWLGSPCREELLRQMDGEVGILILVAAGET